MGELPGRNRLRFDTGTGRYVVERKDPIEGWYCVGSFGTMEALTAWLEQVDRNLGGRSQAVIDSMKGGDDGTR